jgi:hypothetical protein
VIGSAAMDTAIRHRRAVVGVMCACLVGCQVSTAPTDVARWDRQHPVSIMRAPWDGNYTLQTTETGTKGPRKNLQTVHLKKAEELGFRQREGAVVAAAGALEVELSPGEYRWVMIADKGQTDGFTTTVLIVAIVVATVATIVFLATLRISVDIFPSKN